MKVKYRTVCPLGSLIYLQYQETKSFLGIKYKTWRYVPKEIPEYVYINCCPMRGLLSEKYVWSSTIEGHESFIKKYDTYDKLYDYIRNIDEIHMKYETKLKVMEREQEIMKNTVHYF